MNHCRYKKWRVQSGARRFFTQQTRQTAAVQNNILFRGQVFRGAPDNELSVQQDCSDGNSVQKTDGRIVTAFSDIDPVLTYGGERRGRIGADRKIVKSPRYLSPGQLITELLALDQSRVGDRVLAADDRGHSHIEKAGKMLFHALIHEKGASCKCGIGIKTVASQA